jgi:PhnB protein
LHRLFGTPAAHFIVCQPLIVTMQMNPYLNFKGECEAAFQFYERCLGAKTGDIFRYRGSPMADQVPAAWQDKVMHGSITIDGQTLMGADVVPEQFEAPRGFSLSLQIKLSAEAERVFQQLAEGGVIVVPLGQTFWASRFGMLVDRFGVPWMINCEGAA